MRLNLFVVAATLSLTRCTFDATGLSAETSGVPSTTTGDETGPGTATLDPTTGDPTTGTPANCGNSQIDEGEECDNGALNNGKNGSICKADCTKNTCGDSYIASNENCDDGNTVDDDECSNMCKLTDCGNGMLGAGEECDDGNPVDDDACSNLCKFPFCGDGNVGGDEKCDDGVVNGDTQACKLNCTPAMCGDGDVQTGVEDCDDGNQVDNDSCANNCTLASCGDGKPQVGEECDDGILNNDSGACTATCKTAKCGDNLIQTDVEECDDGILNNNNAACTATCKTATCGDKLVQTDVDECDDGNDVNDDACTNLCKTAKCGDMIVQPSVEDCEDGNQNNDDGCAMCKHTCGDGKPNMGEQCDDGNDFDDDFCDTKCMTAAYRVFVTGQKFGGDWDGTEGADTLCSAAATSVDLPNAGKYKAWLSDDGYQPKDGFAKSTLPYRRLDGKKVASNWTDLTDGSLSTPISQTETEQLLGGGPGCGDTDKLVWTNTTKDGSKDGEPHCDNWNSKSDQTMGGLGNALQVNAGWTDGCEKTCNTMARLYCFEQP